MGGGGGGVPNIHRMPGAFLCQMPEPMSMKATYSCLEYYFSLLCETHIRSSGTFLLISPSSSTYWLPRQLHCFHYVSACLPTPLARGANRIQGSGFSRLFECLLLTFLLLQAMTESSQRRSSRYGKALEIKQHSSRQTLPTAPPSRKPKILPRS